MYPEWEGCEDENLSIELPMKTWIWLLAAARHGEQEMFRLSLQPEWATKVEGIQQARMAWLGALNELSGKLDAAWRERERNHG